MYKFGSSFEFNKLKGNMKKILAILLFALTSTMFAQPWGYADPNMGKLSGAFGITWINGQPYYSMLFRPELAFTNIGVGLNLKLEFGADGKLRKENFNETSDYLSIIRYVRYGFKGDPFYAKVGALDYATLGHGSIVYMYNNSPSFDSRRLGFELDADFGRFGMESVFGSFSQKSVAGLRVYARPLRFTSMANTPIINALEIGATYAVDLNRYSGVTAAQYDTVRNSINIVKDKGNLAIMGLDLGLPIHISDIATFTPYYDFVKILDFGSGSSAGLKLDLKGMGVVSVGARLERRFNGSKFLPSYFNAMYEVDRFMADRIKPGSVGPFSKAAILENMSSSDNGYYGELLVRFLNAFDILGSYQRLDKDPESGIVHLSTDISPRDGSFVARAGYDKVRIKDESDLFRLDDRSYLFIEGGYKPYPYLLVSMIYHWTFSPQRDSDDKIIGYKPQKRVEPRISFIYPFDLKR